MVRIILMGLQVFACFGIVGLVLLQRGKGADAGAGFGAGASGTVFGARGARTALSRATAILAAVFMLNSLALAYMGTHQAAQQPKTILDEAAGTSTPEPANDASKTPVVPAPATGTSTSTPETPAPAPSTTPAPATTPAPGEIPAPADGPEKK
jgi:preprotein translocase subunit SecG